MKNLYLFIHINFIPFKVIPSRYNALMPTFFFQPSKYLLNSIPGIAFKPFFDSASFQSCQNGVLGVIFWVWGIARSHTEPNQANMVVLERYSLRFWRDSHEERVQCETAHHRDANTTSYLPKISFETILGDPLEMPIVSERSLIVNRWFLCTNSLIWLMCCSSVYVDGRPGRSKLSTRSLPSLKSLYHL